MDRKEAGKRLVPLLGKYCDPGTVVLATRPASLELAYHVARGLKADLSLLITKNLTYPGHEEYSFGAICEGGGIYIDGNRHLLSDHLIQSIIDKSQRQVLRHVSYFRHNKPLPNLSGKNVILLSDGIDLGLEFIPAIRLCRSMKVNQVIVSVPVAGRFTDKHLNEADGMVVLSTADPFLDMDKTYSNFDPIPEEEVRYLLESYEETIHDAATNPILKGD